MSVKSLGYIVVESTDLQKWEQFACQVLGMMQVEPPTGSSEDCLAFAIDAYPYRLRIEKGQQDRFVLAGWEMQDSVAFHSLVEDLAVEGLGCEIGSPEEAAKRGVREYATVTDPTGTQLEIFYGMKLSYAPFISPVGVSSFVTGHNGDMGLGHLAISTPDLAATHRFYTETLGFGQTDYMHFHFSEDPGDPGQGLHFLHSDNPRHHSVALFEDANQTTGSMVHLMFEVPDIDDLGYMMDRVKQYEVNIVTPMGKHTNDEMVSIYVESPAGFAVEYGFGGLQPDWENYQPTESGKPSLWGHHWG